MIVAGFDIATTTGCAVFDGDSLVRCSAFRPEGDNDAEIFHGFRAWFRGLLNHYGVEYVAIEQPLISSGGPTMFRTLLRLYGLRAIALQSAQGMSIPVLEVNQGTWRKKFTGNGRASKDDTLALVRERYDDSVKSFDAAEAVGVAFYLKTKLATNRVNETSEEGDAA